MISKIIHYIWLGKKKKPENWLDVFESWKKFAEDYEIKEWNEENISEFILPAYFYKAMKDKKYAFASDVLRCFILEKYGGIYFDIDQKLLKSLPDDFLDCDFFTAYFHNRFDYFGFQLTGVKPKHFLMREMIKIYRNYNLMNSYEIINSIFSKLLNRYLIVNSKDMVELDYGGKCVFISNQKIKIFPQEYFYPEEICGHDFSQAYAIHLGNTSWIPVWKKILHRIPGYNFWKKVFNCLLPQIIKNRFINIRYK